MSDRPRIPSEICRKVRQRCGFGCVNCRCPIYDIDHITEYKDTRTHEYDNLVLLCPTCHRKKKKENWSQEKIVALRSVVEDNKGRTSDEALPHAEYVLDVGGNNIKTTSGVIFNIHTLGFLRVKLGDVPCIDAELLDGKGNRALEIADNFYTLDGNTWDIEYEGQTLTFRNKPRDIFAKVTFDEANRRIKFRGSINLGNGRKLQVKDDGIFYNKVLLAKDNWILECNTAIEVTNKSRDQFEGMSYAMKEIGGRISHGRFERCTIGALNCTSCIHNLFEGCEYGFLWTTDYLK